MKKLLLIAASVLAVWAIATPAQAQAATGTVTVLHGIPGVDVDVYVNGDLTLEDFKPETVTDPLELPAGDYDIDIRAAGAADTADPIISGSTTLPAGANASIIANLDAAGTPTLTVFVNDTSQTAAGEGRLVVRHTAAAPAVDVLAGGTPVIEGLTNPNEKTLSLPAGTVSAAVAAAGTTDPVIGPADVPVVAGQVTIVYAIGSLADDSLGVLVQTLKVGEAAAPTDTTAPATTPDTTAPPATTGGSTGSGSGASGGGTSSGGVPVPAGVPSGDSGLAATGGSSFPTLVGIGLLLVALSGVAVSARSLARRR